ncbi:hypothetical protein ICC18_05005 [Paenibacillus sp. WST5]|uniref:Uncharacterized protein n=1 Tax=Paenibacillus sedimenti TaxID=2770274 RepID=A0A926QIE7_9BACL|nr:hypothetical protein [Paenibacillus sedimenti]
MAGLSQVYVYEKVPAFFLNERDFLLFGSVIIDWIRSFGNLIVMIGT